MASIRRQKKMQKATARHIKRQAIEDLHMMVDPTLSREDLDEWGIDDNIIGATVQVKTDILPGSCVSIVFKREIPEMTKSFWNTYNIPKGWLQPLPETKPE